MKKILLQIALGSLVALSAAKKTLTTATARQYVNETAIYDAELPCYSCIINNYIFCQKGNDHPVIANGKTAPAGYCCESYETCPYVKDAKYSCSSQYSDTLFSLYMCPFYKEKCGDSDNLVMKKTGASKSLSQTLLPGDMCFYTTRAECGVPTFTPTGEKVEETDFYTIQYDDYDVEPDFKDDSYAPTSSSGKGSNSKGFTSADEIMLPSKFSPLDKKTAEYDYYSEYYLDWTDYPIYV